MKSKRRISLSKNDVLTIQYNNISLRMSELIEKYNEDKSEDEKLYPTKYDKYYVNKNGEVYSMWYNKIKKLKSCIEKCGYLHVTICVNKEQKIYKVHKLIGETFLSNPHGYPFIDHVDRIRTHNHINNLRWVSNSYNMYNIQRTKYKNKICSSKYKGVYWDKERNKWKAQIKLNGKTIQIGRYDTELEAAKARDEYVIDEMWELLEFIPLNFEIEI